MNNAFLLFEKWHENCKKCLITINIRRGIEKIEEINKMYFILFYFKIKKNQRIFTRRCEKIENENSLFSPLVRAYKTRIFSHSKTRCFRAPGKHIHAFDTLYSK